MFCAVLCCAVPCCVLTQLPEAVLHEFHLLLSLLAAQAAHHYALAGGDLLVARVHQVGQRLKRIAGSQPSVPESAARGRYGRGGKRDGVRPRQGQGNRSGTRCHPQCPGL